MKFPPMAIISILHRISGLGIFLLLPVMIYFLNQALYSPESFNALTVKLAQPLNKLILWAFTAAWIFHLIAGIRHLLMDAGWGEHLESGRQSAIIAIALSVIFTILAGIWIW